jgi:hypothetical protein
LEAFREHGGAAGNRRDHELDYEIVTYALPNGKLEQYMVPQRIDEVGA